MTPAALHAEPSANAPATTASQAPPVVTVRNLTKRFKKYRSPLGRLMEWFSLGLLKRHTLFTALSDISFTVRRGEFFGVIGPNGSGKSTLLKLLTGVLVPSEGGFEINGRVTSLLELGTGFNPELTGRENLINSSRLSGFEVASTRSRIDEIIAFAELEEAIDSPIKYYSTGMVVRLAFSLFAHVEPDVFIVDEALSVGDVAFSRKCFQRLDQMRASGCTLIFVSHDIAAVRKYCDHVMYLDHGRCAFFGSANAATDVYLEAMSPGGRERKLAPETAGASSSNAANVESPTTRIARLRESMPSELLDRFPESSFVGSVEGRIGVGSARIEAVVICDAEGKRADHFGIGDPAEIHLLARGMENIEHATVSVQLVNRLGVAAWGTNHHRLTLKTIPIAAGSWIHSTFKIRLDLGADHYALDASLGDASGAGHVFDRVTAVATIVTEARTHIDFEGVARLPVTSEVLSYGA